MSFKCLSMLESQFGTCIFFVSHEPLFVKQINNVYVLFIFQEAVIVHPVPMRASPETVKKDGRERVRAFSGSANSMLTNISIQNILGNINFIDSFSIPFSLNKVKDWYKKKMLCSLRANPLDKAGTSKTGFSQVC